MVEMGLLPSTCLSIMVKHLFLRWLERVESVAASMLLCRGSLGSSPRIAERVGDPGWTEPVILS
jgi:hypothetical protein